MKRVVHIELIITALFLLSCQAQRKLYQLYKMDDFNINAGNRFVEQIQYLQAVNDISILDTKADGNEYVVNGKWVYLDTAQQDMPNYYSISKRAKELNCNPDSLINCIKTFYQIGVNDFSRDNHYFRFRVVVGFTTNRGYLYTQELTAKVGDTLPATAVRNNDFQYKVVLYRKLDEHWYEYYETK